jgi:hypothetical protein
VQNDAVNEQLDRDLGRVRAALREALAAGEAEHPLDPENELVQEVNRAVLLTDALYEDVAAFWAACHEDDLQQRSRTGLLAVTSLSLLDAQLDVLEQSAQETTSLSAQSRITAGVKAVGQRLLAMLARLKRWLRRVSAALARLLAQHLTVKEWRLGGDAGVTYFFAGSAKIEIAFQ